MSNYRDDREAAHARIETLEAKIHEREASLGARDAEVAELRAEVARLREGGPAAPRTRPASRGLLTAALACAGAAAASALVLFFARAESRAGSPASAPAPRSFVDPLAPSSSATTPSSAADPQMTATIAEALAPLRRSVKACYDHELSSRGNLSGKLVVVLTANAGHVTDVAFEASPVRSATFDGCVTKAFMGRSVPAADGAKINAPFVLQTQ